MTKEAMVISEKEKEKILTANGGISDMVVTSVTKSQTENLTLEQLFEMGKKTEASSNVFELCDDFDVLDLSAEKRTVSECDMVVFSIGGKTFKVTGRIIKTGRSFIIEKGGRIIKTSCGNGYCFVIEG